MGKNKTLTTGKDFVAEAEKIINAKFDSMNCKAIKKRSAHDVLLSAAMVAGCLFLTVVMVFLK